MAVRMRWRGPSPIHDPSIGRSTPSDSCCNRERQTVRIRKVEPPPQEGDLEFSRPIHDVTTRSVDDDPELDFFSGFNQTLMDYSCTPAGVSHGNRIVIENRAISNCQITKPKSQITNKSQLPNHKRVRASDPKSWRNNHTQE